MRAFDEGFGEVSLEVVIGQDVQEKGCKRRKGARGEGKRGAKERRGGRKPKVDWLCGFAMRN
jgi:hypothetical protein